MKTKGVLSVVRLEVEGFNHWREEFVALDKLGRWPTGTWLQRRSAELKQVEATRVLKREK